MDNHECNTASLSVLFTRPTTTKARQTKLSFSNHRDFHRYEGLAPTLASLPCRPRITLRRNVHALCDARHLFANIWAIVSPLMLLYSRASCLLLCFSDLRSCDLLLCTDMLLTSHLMHGRCPIPYSSKWLFICCILSPTSTPSVILAPFLSAYHRHSTLTYTPWASLSAAPNTRFTSSAKRDFRAQIFLLRGTVYASPFNQTRATREFIEWWSSVNAAG